MRTRVSAQSPALSVIVPVHNDAGLLAECLARLAESEYRQFEVIVVDDASTDDSTGVAVSHGAQVIRMPCRSGPAAARNAGARAARGEYLVFLDADVFVRPDTLARLAGAFADPEVDAVFGSYDTTPAAPNFISHYKNLLHHYVHQTSHARASTFWSGCGAVKRSVFSAAGGFDPKFTRPMVEDIELGMRLHKANRQIALDKQVQVTHAKQWSLGGMIRSDICDRAIPWTQLILREKTLPNDLNLSWHQRLSAALACGLFAVLLAGSLQYPVLLVIPLLILALVLAIDRWSERERIPTAARWAGVFVMLSVLGVAGFFLHGLALVILALSLGIVCLNARFYAFFVRERNLLFALAIFPLHLVYYAYSVLSFASVVACHLIRKASLAAGWRSLSVGRRKGGAGWVDPQDGEHALGRTLSEKVNEDPA